TGGTEEEEDEPYQARILEAYAAEGTSYIGNDADLIRWAKEVAGIGDCIVNAAWNGPGTIKLSLVDSNGEPANAALCTAVYNHIISPNDRQARLLQAGSGTLTVVPATTISMTYVCTGIEYNDTTDPATIRKDFASALKSYYTAAKRDAEIRYVKVHAILANIPGVEDFTSLTMNGGTANISLDADEYPATVSIVLS
ncbi:MAG: baseplate J/gp47 family protein, partial [Oscillibacter sp.]|nr:baseplate J/gp47 family protein [Oscillibacter sp.]